MTLEPNQLGNLETGVAVYAPSHWCQDRKGKIIRTNGIHRGTIWAGLDDVFDLGITAPSAAPNVALDVGAGGSYAATYWMGYRYLDDEGIPSSMSPLKSLAAAAADGFDWTLVRSDESRVETIEIWRSQADDSTVLYLVASFDNPVGATETYNTDNSDDATLGANDALPILYDDGSLCARRFEPPPAYKAVCECYKDRYWYGVNVALPAETVTGLDDWGGTSCVRDRYLYVEGQPRPLLINGVAGNDLALEDGSTFTMTAANDDYYRAMIHPGPDERLSLYYSEKDEPESVPPSQNQLIITPMTDEREEVTALKQFATALWVFTDRSTYRVKTEVNPRYDGSCVPVEHRGAVNQNCVRIYKNEAYVLDLAGCWKLTNSSAKPISPPIQDVFRDPQVDWDKSKWFFVSVEPNLPLVRFHVCLTDQSGDRPKTMLCHNPETEAWWTETALTAMSGSAVVRSGGGLRSVVGGEDGKVLMLDEGTSDYAVVTGLISTIGADFIIDTESSGLPGAALGASITLEAANGAIVRSTTGSGKYWGLTTGGAAWPALDSTSEFTVSSMVGDTFTVISAGDHFLTTHVPTYSAEAEFSAGEVGATVEITAGAGIGETRTVTARLQSGMTLDDTLAAAQQGTPPGNQVFTYVVQYALSGTVTSATADTLSDTSASFHAALVGAPVAIVAGTGKGQIRRISIVGANQLTVDEDWDTTPSTDSEYLVGAIKWTYRSGLFTIPFTAETQQKALLLTYQPTTGAETMDLRIYKDHNADPVLYPLPWTHRGVSINTDCLYDALIEMKLALSAQGDSPGFRVFPFKGRAGPWSITGRYLAVEMRGFQAAEQITVYGLEIEGAG
jgi:hypothetical protein